MSDTKKLIDIFETVLEAHNHKEESEILYTPVSPGEFYSSEYYCGLPKNMIPKFWRDQAIEFLEGGYNELIITGSLGSYKTTWANLMTLYKLYELFSYKSIHNYLEIPVIQDVYNIYFSVGLTQAKLTGFKQFREMVDNSRWFQETFPRDKTVDSMIRFPKNNKCSFFSGSGHQHAIGMTVWCFILDEGDFFKKNGSGFDEAYEHVTNMYDELVDRRKSRFQDGVFDKSFSVLISSASFQSSFVEKRIEEAMGDDKAMVIKAIQYKIRPDKHSEEKFVVFKGDAMIDPMLITENKDYKEVFSKLGSKYEIDVQKKVLQNYEILPESLKEKFETPPMDLFDRFRKNLNKSLQNFSGVYIAGIGKLFQSKNLLRSAYTDDLLHPFSKEKIELSTGDTAKLEDYFLPQVLRDIQKPHALHIDASLSGDSTGISMVRYDGECRINGILKRIYSQVFSLEIVPPPAPYQIKLSKLRNFVLYLWEEVGVNIVKITQDQFQSAESLQIYEEKGLNSGKQSIDKNDEPYLSWMNLLMDESVRQYNYKVLEQEAFAAIHDRRKRKVNHPKTGSININVLQSFVGALNNLMTVDLLGVDSINLPIKTGTKKAEALMDKKAFIQEMQSAGRVSTNPIGDLNSMMKKKDLFKSIL